MELKELSKKLINGTASAREKDEFVQRLYEAGGLQKNQFDRYFNGSDSNKRFFLTLANFTYTFTEFVKSNINPIHNTLKFKPMETTTTNTQPLDRFLQACETNGLKRKPSLEKAFYEINLERIRRGNILQDLRDRLKNSNDEDLEAMEDQVRKELYPEQPEQQ